MLVAAGVADQGVAGPVDGRVQVGEQRVEAAFGQAAGLVGDVRLQQGPDPRPVRGDQGLPGAADQLRQQAEDLGRVAEQQPAGRGVAGAGGVAQRQLDLAAHHRRRAWRRSGSARRRSRRPARSAAARGSRGCSRGAVAAGRSAPGRGRAAPGACSPASGACAPGPWGPVASRIADSVSKAGETAKRHRARSAGPKPRLIDHGEPFPGRSAYGTGLSAGAERLSMIVALRHDRPRTADPHPRSREPTMTADLKADVNRRAAALFAAIDDYDGGRSSSPRSTRSPPSFPRATPTAIFHRGQRPRQLGPLRPGRAAVRAGAGARRTDRREPAPRRDPDVQLAAQRRARRGRRWRPARRRRRAAARTTCPTRSTARSRCAWPRSAASAKACRWCSSRWPSTCRATTGRWRTMAASLLEG